jgi:hypothetical protein
MDAEIMIEEWLSVCPLFSGVAVDMLASEDGSVTITRMTALRDDYTGCASQAIGTICSLADHHSVALYAATEPLADSEEDRLRIKTWLMHYGFTPSAFPKSSTMIRVPEPIGISSCWEATA